MRENRYQSLFPSPALVPVQGRGLYFNIGVDMIQNMERKLQFSIGEFYHIYSRGVDKRDIFLDHGDHARFMKLLFLCNGTEPIVFRLVQNQPLDKIERGTKLASVGAYCLMPNHFHLLVRETVEGGIAKYLGKLLTGYSMYFNKKHERVGTLFSSRFHASHADSDEYLRYLFSYIHLNPAKLIKPDWREQGFSDTDRPLVIKHLSAYPYFSYQDYANDGQNNRGEILNRVDFPEYFQSAHDFSDFINDWLAYNDPIQGRGAFL